MKYPLSRQTCSSKSKVLLLQVQEVFLVQAACAVLTNGCLILMYSDKNLLMIFLRELLDPTKYSWTNNNS